MEVFRKSVWHDLGLDPVFVQTNHSHSKKDVVRGLHFQWDPPLTKLIRVIAGAAYFVSVDVRKNSATFKHWHGVELSAENKKLLYVPFGFASGFGVTSDTADVEYHYTAEYNPAGEGSLRFDDPDIGVQWPIAAPIVSARDREAMTMASSRSEASFPL